MVREPVNEALVRFGERYDEYVVLPITVLATLQRLQVNTQWVLCWRQLGDREVLVSQPWKARGGARKSRFIFDKDGRTISRRVEQGTVSVWWQR